MLKKYDMKTIARYFYYARMAQDVQQEIVQQISDDELYEMTEFGLELSVELANIQGQDPFENISSFTAANAVIDKIKGIS
jgi:hypothetical protein